MVREIITPDKVPSAINEITESKYGSHYSIVYHNLKTLRNMYPHLIRQHLEVKNDTVLFLAFYDSTEKARRVLSKNKVDVKKCENKEESLIIIPITIQNQTIAKATRTNSKKDAKDKIR